MESLLVSTLVVAIAEIGDKTQLLALCLAATWRKPVPIILGILIATVANHLLAGAVGAVAGHFLQGWWMKWVLGLGFLAFAAWALIPDKFDDCPPDSRKTDWQVLVATTIAFFLVEMGDKTQVATAALAARFQDLVPVVMGTTLGMLIANVPAVLIGEAAATKLPLKHIRWAAAACFAAVGVWILAVG